MSGNEDRNWDQEERDVLFNAKGMLLDAISVIHQVYSIDYLWRLRRRVENARSMEEVLVAKDMLVSLARFHDVGMVDRSDLEPREQPSKEEIEGHDAPGTSDGETSNGSAAGTGRGEGTEGGSGDCQAGNLPDPR